MFLSLSVSSSRKIFIASENLRSAAPSGPSNDASFGRTSFPSFLSRSFPRCCSAVISSRYHLSASPSGPGTSIGLTISPPLTLDCSIRSSSDLLISSNALTTLASKLPRGPLFSISISFGRRVIVLTRSLSLSRILSKKLTAAFSIAASGPPLSVCCKSIGRTSSPSDDAMRRARRPSSSITRYNQFTSCFSALPNGPILLSPASIGLTYAASSPIMRAKLSSTRLSASVFLNKSLRQ
mmetsp:Transcript_23965/g.35622  ORF Transcript_23965/g.35622 Transcript_23965/m.35622 type:complete len:238 (+) Transcript_23965:209-922(+)